MTVEIQNTGDITKLRGKKMPSNLEVHPIMNGSNSNQNYLCHDMA